MTSRSQGLSPNDNRRQRRKRKGTRLYDQSIGCFFFFCFCFFVCLFVFLVKYTNSYQGYNFKWQYLFFFYHIISLEYQLRPRTYAKNKTSGTFKFGSDYVIQTRQERGCATKIQTSIIARKSLSIKILAKFSFCLFIDRCEAILTEQALLIKDYFISMG